MKWTKSLLLVACIGVFTGSVYAEQRAQDWPKQEEPALRPYKAMWEGLKSFAYHTRQSFIYGNVKCPVFGSIEVFRGMRRGAIEFAGDSYMGMAGSLPRPYKELNPVNNYIDEEPLLHNVSDFATPAIVLPVAGASNALPAAVGIFAGQKVVDEAPMNSEARKEIQSQKASRYYRVKSMQKRYIGDRATVNAAPDGMGNLVKKYQ